jgi:hypothetical protein
LTAAGHAHTNFTAGLPSSFVDDTGLQAASCVTDQNGQCHLNYVVPEVSGAFAITATSQGAASPPKTVNVQLKGLVSLGPGVGFVSTGALPEHPVNHFGALQMAGVVVLSLAADYAAQRKGILGINDMSLQLGGLFDLDRLWDSAGGHGLHRSGKSADIDRIENGSTRLIDIRLLRQLADEHGVTLFEESTHKCLSTPPFTPCLHLELYP